MGWDAMTLKIGDEYPVWWETFDGRPGGQHMAKIIAIEPYRGKFTEFFNVTLTLVAPTTRNGALQMSAKV